MLERHGQLPARAAANPFGTPQQAGNRSMQGTPAGTPVSARGQPGALTPAQQAVLARNMQQQGGGKRSFPAPPPGFGRPGPPMTPVRGQPAGALNMQVPTEQFGTGQLVYIQGKGNRLSNFELLQRRTSPKVL